MTDPDPLLLRPMISAFLAEDIGHGDRTTNAIVAPEQRGRARIEARSDFVVGGLSAAETCFELLGDVAWKAEVLDGAPVRSGAVLVRLDGSLRSILTAERTALNLLARLSGIATSARAFAEAVKDTPARVVDTRKTTPGLRLLEKHAVTVGGCHNHRFGLDDGILVKDNHIAAAGGISEAVARARAAAPHGLVVEVEVEDLDDLDEAMAAGAGAVLLDNMPVEMVREAVARAGGKVVLEVSGGIDLDNVRSYAETGVDLISVGALTHSAPAVDLSLEVEA